MRVYWYWPHPHRAASALILNTRRAGDVVVVHALPTHRGRVSPPLEEYEVVRDLPDPTAPRAGFGRFTRQVDVAWNRSRKRRQVLGRGFDIAVIANLFYQTDWLDLPGIARRTPVISIVHDVRPHVSRFPKAVESTLLRRLYREKCTGELVVFSDVLKDELVAEFGVEPHRVNVVPYALDSADHRIDVARPDAPVVLFFGTLRKNKGIEVLLRALDLLEDDPGFSVVVAGEGTELQYEVLRGAARRHPYLRVECGFVEERRKSELYSQASIVVLPYTEFHSFSAVLGDAYRYRVPVIVTDVGALGPTVRSERTGWVVRPNDELALAEALIAAVADDAGRLERERAIEAAARQHDVKVVGERWRELFDRITGELRV